MPMYFVKFEVIPTEHNAQHSMLQGALAHCWIIEHTEIAAYNKARFFILREEWEITATEEFPVEVTEEDFQDRNIGLAQFNKAQETGIAIAYVGWSRDGKTSAGPVQLERSHKFDLNAYVGQLKKLAGTGRCLHFDRGNQCGEIISAHSIQKNGQLSAITNDGRAYTVTKNIGIIRKNTGRLVLEKHGTGKLSTFLGFCKEHDNQLFAPIDTSPLHPTDEQVLLYAYRSICRELFVKENALVFIDSQLAELPTTSTARQFFEDLKAGTTFGLANLREQKIALDASLKSKNYTDIEYVLFTCRQPQFLAFSGLFFPEHDFLGRQLQDLADQTWKLDLLTISSASMYQGWGFLFAWHKSSSIACREFMRSLATVMHEDNSSASDAMFRTVVSNCENLAFSPAWWEALPAEQQDAVTAHLSHGADIFTPIDPEYLIKGLEGVCEWRFEAVHANPERMART